MSGSRLVRNSEDLGRLVAEGYAVRVVEGHLVVDDIPFVASTGEVERGSFLCPLDVSGDRTAVPSTHVMWFVGGVPCDQRGTPIDGLVNPGVGACSPTPELNAACGFSSKPEGGYPDFYEKVTAYAAMIVGYAQAIDPTSTPLTFKPVETDEEDGAFTYIDTFSSRAGITENNNRLALAKVVVIGLGGTGAYALDKLAKTPAATIHLYDDDLFATHNAFRGPGAPSLEDLQAGHRKVDYWTNMYSRMHRGIVAHPVRVSAENVHEILDADFVFLAMDSGPDKQVIIEALVAGSVPFVDTGVGVSNDADGVAGQVRVTSGAPGRYDHIARANLISVRGPGEDDYETNLQVAELNSIAADQAVMRFKKHFGFYRDDENEQHVVYATATNDLHSRFGVDDAPSPSSAAAPAGAA